MKGDEEEEYAFSVMQRGAGRCKVLCGEAEGRFGAARSARGRGWDVGGVNAGVLLLCDTQHSSPGGEGRRLVVPRVHGSRTFG